MKYSRGYIRIAGWLFQKNKITKREYQIHYWIGIPSSFRAKLEARLMAQKPTHNLEDPFKVSDINKAAENLLRRDRFDTERIASDRDDDSESEPSDSDSDSSSSSDDEHASRHDKHHHQKRKRSGSRHRRDSWTRKRVTFERKGAEPPSESDSDAPPRSMRKSSDKKSAEKKPQEKKKKKEDKELDDLIGQLSKMSVHDERYAATYFKAFTKNPAIKDIIPTPKEQLERQQSRTFPRSRSFDRQPPPHIGSQPSGPDPEDP